MKRRSFLAAIAGAIAAPAMRSIAMPPPNLVDWPGSLTFVKPPPGGLTPFAIWDSLTIDAGVSVTEKQGGRPWPFFGAPAPAQFFLERMSIDFPYWQQTDDLGLATRDIEELLEYSRIRLASGDRPLAEMPLWYMCTRHEIAKRWSAPVEIPLWPTWGVDEKFQAELALVKMVELERALTVRMSVHGYVDANLLAPGQK